MHTSRTAVWGVILIALLLTFVLPASALISLSADAVFDATDTTPSYGQEGQVQIV